MLGGRAGFAHPMTMSCAIMGASSAPPSLNHGAARRMVPFDHIAVMGIFGLNALDTLQFDACIGGCEVPIGLGVMVIALVLPGGDFLDECLLLGDAAIEALRR